MEKYWMYPDELTEIEEELGFERVLVSNPQFQYYGHSSIIPAVVFSLGPGSRIIKMANPVAGVAVYSHQIYGTYGSVGRPNWNPVLVPYPTPHMAIRTAQTGDDITDPIAPRITPAPPAIPLRCPKCLIRFEAEIDCLALDGVQKCSSCSFEGLRVCPISGTKKRLAA